MNVILGLQLITMFVMLEAAQNEPNVTASTVAFRFSYGQPKLKRNSRIRARDQPEAETL